MISKTISGSKAIMVELRTVDIFALAYIVLISVLEILFRSNIHNWQSLLIENIFLLIALFVLVSVLGRIQSSTVRTLSRVVLYMLLMPTVYRHMGGLIHLIFPYWWDGQINAAESALFHGYPTVLLQGIVRPWLTEFMMFIYVIYVALFPAVTLFIWLKGKQHQLEQYVTEIVLTNFVCYLFYFLFPVNGPSRDLAALHIVPLHGYFFTSVTEYMAANVHLPGGAFPSAHCAATVVMLAALYRCSKPIVYGFIPLMLLIFASTVYGRFHYISDVIAGILLAILTLWMIPKLRGMLDNVNLNLGFLLSPRMRTDAISDTTMNEDTI